MPNSRYFELECTIDNFTHTALTKQSGRERSERAESELTESLGTPYCTDLLHNTVKFSIDSYRKMCLLLKYLCTYIQLWTFAYVRTVTYLISPMKMRSLLEGKTHL